MICSQCGVPLNPEEYIDEICTDCLTIYLYDDSYVENNSEFGIHIIDIDTPNSGLVGRHHKNDPWWSK